MMKKILFLCLVGIVISYFGYSLSSGLTREPYDVSIPLKVKIIAYLGRFTMNGMIPPSFTRWIQSRKVMKSTDKYEFLIQNMSYKEFPEDEQDVTIKLSSYTPKGLKEEEMNTLPIFLYYHGGGFTIGHPNTMHEFFEELLSTENMIIIAPNYRKIPENTVDSAIRDGLETLRWIRRKYGSDRKIVIVGSSAGGRIALAVTYFLKKTNYVDYEKKNIVTVPIYASFCRTSGECRINSEFKNGYITNEKLCEELTAEEKEYYFDFNDLENLPKMLVVTAEYCYFRDEAWNWVMSFSEDQKRPNYLMIEKELHGFMLPMLKIHDQSVTKLVNGIVEMAIR